MWNKEYTKQWRLKNKEHIIAYQKKVWKNYVLTPERIEARRIAWKKYNAKASTKIRKHEVYLKKRSDPVLHKQMLRYNAIWQKKNPIRMSLKHSKYLKTKKGKLVSKFWNNARRISNSKYKLSVDKLKKAFEKTKGFCPYCNKKIEVETSHLDHIKPVSKGGTNHLNNLIYCCSKCNLKKHNLSLKAFKEKLIYINGVNNGMRG